MGLFGGTFCWVAIAHYILSEQVALFDLLVLALLIAFFVVGTLVFVWRGMTSPETVIVLSPKGLQHAWISPETIPWSKITNVNLSEIGFSRLIWLHVEPEFASKLQLHPVQRWMRCLPLPGNEAFTIGTHALAIDTEYLHDQLIRYARANGGSVQ